LWLVPPLLLLCVARGSVFNATTPPETPFLDNPIRGVNFFAGRLTAMQVTARLWGVMVFPYNLSCAYSFNQVPTFGKFSTVGNNLFCLLSALLVFSLVALAVWLWFKNINKPVAFFILFFFATYFPTSNLLVVIGSIMAERFMYLPVIGFIGALVLLIE